MFLMSPDRIYRDMSTEAASVRTVMRSTAEEKAMSPKLRCIEVAMRQRYVAPTAVKKTAGARRIQGIAILYNPHLSSAHRCNASRSEGDSI